jgi:hypothetical protein
MSCRFPHLSTAPAWALGSKRHSRPRLCNTNRPPLSGLDSFVALSTLRGPCNPRVSSIAGTKCLDGIVNLTRGYDTRRKTQPIFMGDQQ